MLASNLLAHIVVALSVAGGAFGAVTPRAGVHKTAPAIAPEWRELGQANHGNDYTLTFSLHPANQDGLTARMQQIAATGGEWLTADEVASYVAPKAEDLASLQTFLKSQGIQDNAISYSPAKDTVTVKTTVGKAAAMFAADLLSFSLSGSDPVARAKSLIIPAEIASAVLDVAPLLNFGRIIKTPSKVALSPAERNATLVTRQTTGCSTSLVTPTCLRNLYQTSSYTPSSSTEGVTVMGYIDQYASQADLTQFLNSYRPDAASATLNIQTTAGATNNQNRPGDEANLDVQTVVSQTYPLKTTFLGYGTSTTSGDIFSKTFQYFLSQTTKPGVISISYGSDEAGFTKSAATSMCNYAQQLTAQGTTIVVSSGDYGVSGQSGDTCPPFVPTYPSGCPYILSVGATQNFGPEVAVDTSLAGFWSGAGFSNVFSTPSYQSSAVSAYESKISSTSASTGNYFNKNGRAFPDVSAQGSLYAVVVGGTTYKIGGTSASAPTMASVLALVNDARKAVGKGRIGWIHPTIYGNTAGFTDLTGGASKGCGSTSLGLLATSGYDAVTGLGTPLFSGLRSVFGA
ncbi:hypothetical protein OC842_003465 [Tilletia horrida]|uniref:tripeptidyl-peptidase II n=1 Tax=Tilletia horrida TaxID=155126 RepID=A0AAN6JKQ5_9BASI|nr:hypothetical protein OC842_003465 [Tilletia horrida]